MTIQKLALLYQVDLQDVLSEVIDTCGLGQRPKKKVWQDPESIGELSAQERSLIALLRTCDHKELQTLIDNLKLRRR